MNQSFGFKKGSFVIRGPLVSVVIPAIAFIYQIYSLLSSPFGSLPENFQGCTYITTKICKRNIEGWPRNHPSNNFSQFILQQEWMFVLHPHPYAPHSHTTVSSKTSAVGNSQGKSSPPEAPSLHKPWPHLRTAVSAQARLAGIESESDHNKTSRWTSSNESHSPD